MKVAAEKYGFVFGLLATAAMVVSCASDHREPAASPGKSNYSVAEKKALFDQIFKPVYGEAGPDKVEIYIYGAETKNPGIFYFKSGTTLGSAISAVKLSDFAGRLIIYNLAGNLEQGKRCRFQRLKPSEKKMILHDCDCLVFPVTCW